MTKAELRRAMKARLAALPPEAFHAEGLAAAERLCGTEVWRRFRRVLLYRSIGGSGAEGGEIDTWPLIERAFAAGKALYFPKTFPERSEMRFFRVDGPEGPWAEGNYGIIEPAMTDADRLFDPGQEPALVITPGLAFDREGRRTGRGRGYYDRFFAALDRAAAPYAAAGFCLDCQIVEAVPADPHDRPLDALCTAGTFLSFA